MTPKFTTPCFVQVEDKDKRKEVCKKLEQIGYAIREPFCAEEPVLLADDEAVVGFEDKFLLDCVVNEDNVLAIDCSTNTALFLALAGMRSDTDKGQWFTTKGSEYRKATAAEIIEHFNAKEK